MFLWSSSGNGLSTLALPWWHFRAGREEHFFKAEEQTPHSSSPVAVDLNGDKRDEAGIRTSQLYERDDDTSDLGFRK